MTSLTCLIDGARRTAALTLPERGKVVVGGSTSSVQKAHTAALRYAVVVADDTLRTRAAGRVDGRGGAVDVLARLRTLGTHTSACIHALPLRPEVILWVM